MSAAAQSATNSAPHTEKNRAPGHPVTGRNAPESRAQKNNPRLAADSKAQYATQNLEGGLGSSSPRSPSARSQGVALGGTLMLRSVLSVSRLRR